MSPRGRRRATGAARNTATDRILRRLSLLGYLGGRERATFGELADLFGVPPSTIVTDIHALWVVNGRPGDDTMDYVDFDSTLPEDFEPTDRHDEAALAEHAVWLRDAQGLDRQVPLSTRETVAMSLGLRQLGELARALPAQYAGIREAVASASAKLVAARPGLAAPVEDQEDRAEDAAAAQEAARAALAAVREALHRGRVLHLRYLSAADVVSERDVDPVGVVGEAGTWALQAWCHRAAAPRTFRVDRILEARITEEPVHPRHVAAVQGAPSGAAQPPHRRPEARTVEIEVLPAALWRIEDVPHEGITRTEEGTLSVRLPVADPAWLAGFLLRLGTGVVAVRPAEAGWEAAARAATTLRAYAELDEMA